MAGRPPGPEAYLGLHEDQLFVQPADGAEVLHNGVPVQRSTWLRSGDVVNLGAARLRIADNDSERVVEVDDGSGGNITAPPIISASARLQGQSDGDAERIEAIRFRASEAAKPVRRISLSPLRVVLAAVARRRRGRAVVHFHGDVGQPAHGPDCGERARFRRAARRASRRSRAAATRQLPRSRRAAGLRARAAADQGHERAEPGVHDDAREAAGSVAHRCSRGRARHARRQGSRQRAG